MKPTITRVLGAGAFVLLGITVVLGLFVTGPDAVQGEEVRLLYIHPAVAWVAYLAFGLTSIASILWLIPATRRHLWDHIAGASAEVGTVFIGLALVTGSIWGRATWGVWWTWDARLTTTLVLFVLYLGVLALRRMPASFDTRARRSSIAALLAFVDVPIVHLSVTWWRTLHQDASILNPSLELNVHGLQVWTMLISFVAFTLAFAWLVVVRTRCLRWEDEVGDHDLAVAIEARRAEAATGALA